MEGLHIQKNKVAVIGFGISGISVSKYFLKQGISVDVFDDKKESDFSLNLLEDFKNNNKFAIYFSDTMQSLDITSYDYVIASPGVPLSHKIIELAKQAGVEYGTDIGIFLKIFRKSYAEGQVVSVTGSNGKSTTVSLLYSALRAGNVDAYLGGNIGTSPLDFFDQIKTEKPVVILETSSYQLEYIKEPDYFDIACILNLSDNHLNRYGGKKELYAQAKLGGINSEHTHVLVNLDDAYTQKYILPALPTKQVLGIQFEHVQNSEAITVENNSILYVQADDKKVYLPDVTSLKVKGLHNIYNCAFVCGVLHLLEIEPTQEIHMAISEFSGLIHRVQHVATIQGVVYINDSKSTSPDATIKAIETIGSNKNIVLLSGGNDKEISYESMSSVWEEYVKGLILLPGSANQKLKNLASQTGVELLGEIQTMQDAIDITQSYAHEGDIVLLSPATDSHASFKSFEDRGNQFIQCVQNLKN